jgi:hypothetical protein
MKMEAVCFFEMFVFSVVTMCELALGTSVLEEHMACMFCLQVHMALYLCHGNPNIIKTVLYCSGKSIHPFCNKVKRDPLETECTEDRSSVALCNLVEHQEKLPLIYQVREAE